MTLHLAHFSPVNDDDGMPPFRADFLRRYFSDAAFRAQEDAKRDREALRRHVEIDRQILANFSADNFPETPGWVEVFKARVAAFDKGEG